jgi:outer membrane protein assembly factor BamA
LIKTASISLLLLISGIALAQEDTLSKFVEKNAPAVDSLKLKVKAVAISGNEITKDDIILREMSLKRGGLFTIKKYTQDILNIYNLGLFTKVDILPIPVANKEIVLNVDLQERWYIYPLPAGGVEDGEYWKKFWAAINFRWDNFRGRNEQLNFYGRVYYNPAVSFSYSVPWIGKKAHLFSSYSIGYSKTRNQSLIAVGQGSQGNTLTYEDNNYDNFNFNTALTVGKYLNHDFSLFTQLGYNSLRVSAYAPGRSINVNGKDKYIIIALGAGYDSRNIREYATKGYYMQTSYSRFGLVDAALNFGRFSIESQSFIPFYITKNYFITLASRVFSSLAIGAAIPVYNHEILGYSSDYVRGWKGFAFEGEDKLTAYNELRIPVISPRYINAAKLPIAKSLPIIKNMELRYGLFFTIIYDVGTVFYNDESIYNKRFLSGTGIGLDFVAPFGYMVRTEWTFRLGKPKVGQFSLSLNAKF